MSDIRAPCPNCKSRETLDDLRDKVEKLRERKAEADRERIRQDEAMEGATSGSIFINSGTGGLLISDGSGLVNKSYIDSRVTISGHDVCADCGTIYNGGAIEEAERIRDEIKELKVELDPIEAIGDLKETDEP